MPRKIALLLSAILLAGCSTTAKTPALPESGAIIARVAASVPQQREKPLIHSVAFADDRRGWILFHDGTALATRDGGATWQQADLPYPFTEMAFFGDGLGLAWTAEATYRTADGGIGWEPVDSSGWPGTDAQFVDAEHGWVLRHQPPGLFATADGGATWQEVGYPCPQESVAHFSFLSPHTGWMLCGFDEGAGFQSKRLFRTGDGGRTWELLTESLRAAGGEPWKGRGAEEGLTIGDYARSLVFVDERRGWFTGGRYASFMTTRDGGRTWERAGPSLGKGPAIVRFASPQHGYLYGTHELLITRDGGATWQRAYPPVRPEPRFRLSAAEWIGDLEGRLFRTEDRGENWVEQGRLPEGERLLALSFADREIGWALTEAGAVRRLYRTSDGGATWNLASAAPELQEMKFVQALSASEAVLWDRGPGLLLTSDGGATFRRAATPPSESGGHGVAFASLREGWAARDLGLHKTADGGATWQPLAMPAGLKAQGVALGPDGRLWSHVVDVMAPEQPVSKLLASSDGGRTWTHYDLGGFDQPHDLFRCGLDAICVRSGGNGDVIASHDGGATWEYWE